MIQIRILALFLKQKKMKNTFKGKYSKMYKINTVMLDLNQIENLTIQF